MPLAVRRVRVRTPGMGVSILLTAAGLWPPLASAHLVTTGLGPLYDGISHFFLTLDDVLPVLALAVLGGLNGAAGGRRVLFSLPFAWLAGGLAGYWAGSPDLTWPVAAFSAIVLGILVAADRRLPLPLLTGLAILLGLLHGWMNGTSIATASRGALALIGIAASAFVAVALVAGGVVALRAPWTRVAARVAGSWIAAVGLLLLGWFLRA